MFLSRYLERLTGLPVVFGLESAAESDLRRELDGCGHPAIVGSLATPAQPHAVMAKRYAQMLARNRARIRDIGPDEPVILSDHGFHNFLRFLLDPRDDEIIAPEEILARAASLRLQVVYLYRDLGSIVSSLAHFLASRKSFLLAVDGVDRAMELAVEVYAPVLAAHMTVWKRHFYDPRILPLTYDEVVARPESVIRRICTCAGLPYTGDEIITDADQYKSWTYRAGRRSWKDSMSPRQQALLTAKYADLVT